MIREVVELGEASPSKTGYNSCFISYSSKDQEFAEKLFTDLQERGVRCWFALKNIRIGEKLRDAIDQGIRDRERLLLILSENSVISPWVEKEVETAFEEEASRRCGVLFPIRLDASVMSTQASWAADIRRSRHIGDFSAWKEPQAYQRAFQRLLQDLEKG
jgi:predicted adenine nucleotide alpha hydrolase (AANH) superfamily ATPase